MCDIMILSKGSLKFKSIVVARCFLLMAFAVAAFVFFIFFDNKHNPSPGPLPQIIMPQSSDCWDAILQLEIDYWKTIRVDTMTPKQIIDYFSWSNRTACKITHYYSGVVEDWPVRGVDGQYAVCLDPAVTPEQPGKIKSCLVYSFGINNNWSFDEAMEEYSCEVFSFDPSINKTDHDLSKGIHFYDIGFGDKDVDSKLVG